MEVEEGTGGLPRVGLEPAEAWTCCIFILIIFFLYAAVLQMILNHFFIVWKMGPETKTSQGTRHILIVVFLFCTYVSHCKTLTCNGHLTM